jgi:hypothetical protein
MKTFRTTRGPFAERPYYEDSEIETMCADALRHVGLLPDSARPIRIDRFIEKRFSVVPSYEELPDGVLGLTRFGESGAQQVVVAKALDDETGEIAERRVRTTLAHEAGHCLMHAHLFVLATPSRNLFGDFSEPNRPKVLCRDETVCEATARYSGQWWEFQANRAIGALLLPMPIVHSALDAFTMVSPAGFRSFDHERTELAVRKLAELFDVNPAVARIRISQLFPVDSRKQLTF